MKFHDEQSVDKGLLLEDIYRKKLMEKLQGEASPELADRIMGSGDTELDGLTKRPVYEELQKIPLNDQLRMMDEHFKSIRQQNYDPEMDNRLDNIRRLQLVKGQRVG